MSPQKGVAFFALAIAGRIYRAFDISLLIVIPAALVLCIPVTFIALKVINVKTARKPALRRINPSHIAIYFDSLAKGVYNRCALGFSELAIVCPPFAVVAILAIYVYSKV